MQENCFYFIKDEFFEKFKEEKLLINHMNNKNRPCFYALKNNNEDIYWLIPISSKVKKYKEIYNIKMNKFKKCDTIVFGNVLGYEKAFLIQNIFPITSKYILNKYFDKNNNEVKIEKYLEKDIKQKSKKIIAIQRKGINITFANIIKMEKVLIDELKSTNKVKL